MLLNHYRAQEVNTPDMERTETIPHYNDLRLSSTGKWLLARTLYGQNTDTILLFDTKYPQNIYKKLVKLNVKQDFIAEKFLFAQGNNTADLTRLDDLHTISYKGVKKADVLSQLNQYVIADEHQVLTVYNVNAQKVKEVRHVEDYVTDGKDVLIAIIKKDSAYHIINVLDKIPATLFSTTHTLSAVPQFATGNYAAFTETEAGTGRIRSILLNTKTSAIQIPLKETFTDADFFKLTSIQDGSYFLIESEKRKAPEKNFMEIRYGNDPYMRFKKRGIPQNNYWLFNTREGTVQYLPTDSGFDFISINSKRFFVALNKAEQFDYRFAQPVFGLFLFNLQTKTFKKLADAVRTAEASATGRFIVMRNELTMEWWLVDTVSLNQKNLGKNISNPFFSSDESILIFEGEDGVKIYSLSQDQFLKTLLPGLQSSIKRKSSFVTFQKFGVTVGYSGEKIADGITIKALDKDKNESAYYQWDGKKITAAVPTTKNLVKNFETASNRHRSEPVYTIEESNEQRPQIFQSSVGGYRKICMTCDQIMEVDPNIKQKIIPYTNSFGKDLKGILYYPLGYQPAKTYPMIVKIYMEQSGSSNTFLMNKEGGDGFNLRSLLENGFFVFLPDIVMDQRGSGLSALDCVHRSLDALRSIKAIDHNRIGLTGHSFGGYETNFIATHSNRFKAYISSAGVSNLTSHYFTNNPHSAFNEYSRVENGQYNMRQSFSEDKQLYWNNNPIYYAEKVNAPILLWAGLKDNNVLPSQTLEFYTALVRNRKDVIAIFYSEQGHILEPESTEISDISKRTMEWWNYFLKDEKDIEWVSKQMKTPS